MSPALRVLGAAVILLIAAGAFGSWLDLPTTRYQSYLEQYRKIYLEEGPVDVLVIGTSATQTVMAPELLADLLKKDLGRNVVVYDLSKSWRGDDFTYVTLRDFFEQRRTAKQIVIEYRWNGGDSHDHFYQVANLSDIFRGAIHKDGYPWPIRMQDVLTLCVQKSTYFVSTLILGNWVKPPSDPVRPATTSNTRPNDPTNSEIVTAETRLHAPTYATAPDRSWDWRGRAESRNRYFHREIVAMAMAAGAEVTFVELPLIYRPPLKAKMAKDISDYYQVDFITKTRAEMEEIFPGGYTDHGHYTDRGRENYMKWLASRLAPKLRNE